jgi:hypothetical protein
VTVSIVFEKIIHSLFLQNLRHQKSLQRNTVQVRMCQNGQHQRNVSRYTYVICNLIISHQINQASSPYTSDISVDSVDDDVIMLSDTDESAMPIVSTFNSKYIHTIYSAMLCITHQHVPPALILANHRRRGRNMKCHPTVTITSKRFTYRINIRSMCQK